MYAGRIDHTAWHEAGHALVAIKQKKLRVLEAHYDGATGYVSFDRDGKPDSEVYFEKLCFYLAGIAAEKIYAPGGYNRHICISDIQEVSCLLSFFGDKELVEKYRRAAQETVDRILQENAVAVKEIASALMEYDYLSGDELIALYDA